MTGTHEVVCGACLLYRATTEHHGYCGLLAGGPQLRIRKDFTPQANLRAEEKIVQAEKIERGEVICFVPKPVAS